MTKYIRALLGIAIGIAALVVAFGMIQRETLTGSEVSPIVNRGELVVTHVGTEPIAATITARSSYRVVSSNPDVTIAATRERVDNVTTYRYEGEFPAGDITLRITGGTGITFALVSDGTLTAKTVPYSTQTSIIIMVIAVVIFLGGLYYASSATNHHLVKKLTSGMPFVGRRMKSVPSPSM